MTFPPGTMVNVTRAVNQTSVALKRKVQACSKHEKQLQCGSVYEGTEVTKDRIAELKEIGNHKIMFDKECKDPKWTAKVYPCIGRNVAEWMGDCKSVRLF